MAYWFNLVWKKTSLYAIVKFLNLNKYSNRLSKLQNHLRDCRNNFKQLKTISVEPEKNGYIIHSWSEVLKIALCINHAISVINESWCNANLSYRRCFCILKIFRFRTLFFTSKNWSLDKKKMDSWLSNFNTIINLSVFIDSFFYI